MKHLMKYLSTPLAFAAVFLLFGAPSAPGVAAVEAVIRVDTGIGDCAMAYAGSNDGMGESGCVDIASNPYTNPCVSCEEAADRRDYLLYYGIALSAGGAIMGASGVGVFGMAILAGTAAASFSAATYIARKMEDIGC